MEYQQGGLGSCEPCKRKKCKCDRRSPICSQCESSRMECKYSENNKRGIPTGYLGLLEQRLDETEAALFNSLRELHRLGPLRLATREVNPSKIARMEEWKEYPLQDQAGLERWLGTRKTLNGRSMMVINQHEVCSLEDESSAESSSSQLHLSQQNLEHQQHPLHPNEPSVVPDVLLFARDQHSRAPYQSQPSTCPPAQTQATPSRATFQSSPQAQLPTSNYADTANVYSTAEQAGLWEREHGSSQQHEQRRDESEMVKSQQLAATLSHIYY